MALAIVASARFIELSLDGITDFNMATDLIGLGLPRNAPNGIRITKISFDPNAQNDEVIIRDGPGGPRIFKAIALGAFDVQESYYREGGKLNRGQLVHPFIAFAETVIAVPNQVFVTFSI